MKTLFKRISERAAIEKRRGFESATGVKWNFYASRGGYRFCPVISRDTPSLAFYQAALLPHIGVEAIGFLELSRKSGVSLFNTLAGARSLFLSQKALLEVDRSGYSCAIRLARKSQEA